MAQCCEAFELKNPRTLSADMLPSILLVDDDELSRRLVSALLASCGYQVACAASAQEATQRLAEFDIKLILTDVVMPEGGDGLDLLESVQANPAWRKIPVVMMSANDCMDTVQECLQRGASHYILKPVTKKEVQALWQHTFRSATSAATPVSSAHIPELPCAPSKHAATARGGGAATPQSALEHDAQTHSHAQAAHLDALPVAPGRLAAGARNTAAHDAQTMPSDASPTQLLGAGAEVPLHACLECQWLPWHQRLTTFCHLLHSSLRALRQSAPVDAAPKARAFSCPSGVFVTQGGMLSARVDPVRRTAHAVDACYSLHDGSDEAACVYALGALLLELLLGPAPSAARVQRLQALPSLPPDALTSQPEICILVLRMTAAQPGDRPSLADVSTDAAIARSYQQLETKLDADAHSAAAVEVTAEHTFLQLAEAQQHQRVEAITALLARLNDDLARVQATADSLTPRQLPEQGSVHSLPDLAQQAAAAASAPIKACAPQPEQVFSERGGRLPGKRGGSPAPSASGTGSAAAPPVTLPCKRPTSPCVEPDTAPCVVLDAVKVARHGGASSAGAADSSGGPLPPPQCHPQCTMHVSAQLATGYHHKPFQEERQRRAAPAQAAAGPPGHLPRSAPTEQAAQRRFERALPVFPHFFDAYTAQHDGKYPDHGAHVCGAAAANLGRQCAMPHDDAMMDRDDPEQRHASRQGAVLESTGLPERLCGLAADLQAATRYERIDVLSTVQHNPTSSRGRLQQRKMVCAVALDRTEENLATIGVNKSVRIYRFADLAHAGQHAAEVRYPVLDVNFRSKLSSACYNTYIQPRLAVSDFDGALQVWDTQHNADVVAFDEHTDRVWSVDCSVLDPSMILSASMDGSAKLWDSNVERSVVTISPGSQVCSAVFCPDNSNLLALGTASCQAQIYDLRRTTAPLAAVRAPRAVSYVKIAGNCLYASVVNSSVQMYDLPALADGLTPPPMREFKGHLNERNFVGLAVNQDGYVFSGSETNEVAVYHNSVPALLKSKALVTADEATGAEGVAPERPIVSCVTATKGGDVLVAAGTTGWVHVLRLV